MIDFRRIVGRIGYVLLIVWEAVWLGLIAMNISSGTTHATAPVLITLLAILVGCPLAVFLIWRLFRWIHKFFIRAS